MICRLKSVFKFICCLSSAKPYGVSIEYVNIAVVNILNQGVTSRRTDEAYRGLKST